MNAAIFPTFLLLLVIGLAVGFFLILKPMSAIEIQKKFYAMINWKIEPISLAKEFRNTRLMGGFLVVILVITIVLILANKISISAI